MAALMPCYHPLAAFQKHPGAPLYFGVHGSGQRVEVPCGQCIGCRLEYSRQWAVRCYHESKMHQENCFLTLTYDDVSLPADLSLRPKDFTLFLKRLRELLRRDSAPQIRFYMCGEYGDKNGRPHYHSIIFGFSPADKVFYRTSGSGHRIYTSQVLDEVWRFGRVFVGDVTFESAAYVARYVVKKVNGAGPLPILDVTTGELTTRVKEYCRASNRGGIGKSYVEKFPQDVFAHDRVVVRGVAGPVPRYYQKLLKVCDEGKFEANRSLRMKRGREKAMALVDEAVRDGRGVYADVRRGKDHEVVKLAQISNLKRSL